MRRLVDDYSQEFYFNLFHLEATRPTKQFSTIGAFVTGEAVPPFGLDHISKGW